jgi:hypothetical protein
MEKDRTWARWIGLFRAHGGNLAFSADSPNSADGGLSLPGVGHIG